MAWKGKRKGKSMIRSKKAFYNGIEFQSLLEKKMYQLLHEQEIPVEYEEHSFTIFDALVYPQACYEGTAKKLYNKGSKVRSINYTPDFVDPNGKWIIETKGYANESFPLRWKLFKRHLKENNLAYVLFMPRNKIQCLEVLELIKQL
jgi:hypothetical protein|tara:strand:+ start:415 stop:852 length:438 start_codon:yes stop_codon:yes gene_type:complete